MFQFFNYYNYYIPCILDTITNSPVGHQLTTQTNKNVCIVYINVKDTITSKGEFDEQQWFNI